jgi:DnaJ-class molecular chaperone
MAQTNRQATNSRTTTGNPPLYAGDAAPGAGVGTRETVCPACHGTGMVGGETCENCNGTGNIIAGIGGARRRTR